MNEIDYRGMFDELEYQLYLWGNKLGLFLVFAPTLHDVLKTGYLGFWEWSVEPTGIACMLLGGVLLWLHDRVEKRLNERTK